jgi:hypothetical protein
VAHLPPLRVLEQLVVVADVVHAQHLAALRHQLAGLRVQLRLESALRQLRLLQLEGRNRV